MGEVLAVSTAQLKFGGAHPKYALVFGDDQLLSAIVPRIHHVKLEVLMKKSGSGLFQLIVDVLVKIVLV